MTNTTLFNTLSNSENLAVIGVNSKRGELFTSFALDFMTDKPVALKSYLLASEYQLHYDTIQSDIDKLTTRNSALENQLAEWQRKSNAVIGGEWTLTRKVKGIEQTYTYADLEKITVATMNNNTEKILALRQKKDLLYNILNTDGVTELLATPITSAENIAFSLLRYDLCNSKCLDIKNSFTDLASACQAYNREKLKGTTTKDTYMAMKKAFSALADMVKVTKDTKGEFMNVKTFNFNSEEMDILANTLFSSANIGIIEVNKKSYYNLTPDGKLAILKNIVKIVLMKLQGTKVTLENI